MKSFSTFKLSMLLNLISDVPCWVHGLCQGIFVDEIIADNANSCKDFCIGDADCSWFTYNSMDGACLLLEDCQHLDTDCDTCLSGRRECSDQNEGKRRHSRSIV